MITASLTTPDFEPNTLVLEDQSLRHGFIQLPKQILYAANLSRDAKILYAILLGYAWQEEQCFPGYARLCADMQASENMVRKYMRELETIGLLSQKRRGLGKTNLYKLPDLRTSKIEVHEPQKSAVPKPTKTEVYKETEEKESKHHHDDAVASLEAFGITPKQAQRLAAMHPPEVILEKLDIVQYLQAIRSPTVNRNPPGFLIRAIDEAYPPPTGYRTKAERAQEEERHRHHEELVAREIARAAQAQEEARTTLHLKQQVKTIPKTDLTTKTAWELTLDRLEAKVSPLAFELWLSHTVLLTCASNQATVGTANTFQAQWLTKRLTPLVAEQLSAVIGHKLSVRFEAVPNPQAPPKAKLNPTVHTS